MAAGADEVVVYDSLVRGTREQVDRMAAGGNVRLVEGDIRDAGLVERLARLEAPSQLVDQAA